MSAPSEFQLVGVVHLLPLPGGPRPGPGLAVVVERALRDTDALLQGGVRSAVIENFGDAPFAKADVEPHVVAGMVAIGWALRQRFGDDLQLGVNVLRNDALAALAVASVLNASFVRVNVLSGATWTDQGLIEGRARDVLQYRRQLGCGLEDPSPIRICGDVSVKHGVPAGETDVAELARDTALRAGADVLIVTGRHTGGPTSLDAVRRVVAAVPGHPVWVGSGVDVASVGPVVAACHGAIVGTSLHRDGDLSQPLDPTRVRQLVAAVGQASAER